MPNTELFPPCEICGERRTETIHIQIDGEPEHILCSEDCEEKFWKRRKVVDAQ